MDRPSEGPPPAFLNYRYHSHSDISSSEPGSPNNLQTSPRRQSLQGSPRTRVPTSISAPLARSDGASDDSDPYKWEGSDEEDNSQCMNLFLLSLLPAPVYYTIHVINASFRDFAIIRYKYTRHFDFILFFGSNRSDEVHYAYMAFCNLTGCLFSLYVIKFNVYMELRAWIFCCQ